MEARTREAIYGRPSLWSGHAVPVEGVGAQAEDPRTGRVPATTSKFFGRSVGPTNRPYKPKLMHEKTFPSVAELWFERPVAR